MSDALMEQMLNPIRVDSVDFRLYDREFYSLSISGAIATPALLATLIIPTGAIIQSIRLSYSGSLPTGTANIGFQLWLGFDLTGISTTIIPATTPDGFPNILFAEKAYTVNSANQREFGRTVTHYFYPYLRFPSDRKLNLFILKDANIDVRGSYQANTLYPNSGKKYLDESVLKPIIR
jgi:hypothetical protein